MEIKQLEYFAAAVEYGSLNRAADLVRMEKDSSV